MKTLLRIAIFLLFIALLLFLSAVYLDTETRTLDQSERSATDGSYVQLQDGITHYELTGPPNAPVAVLICGVSVPYFIWDATAPDLAKAGFRVLRYDLFGRGYSDRPRVVYDLQLFTRQLKNLLSALNIQTPVSLVGISIGAEIAADFAIHEPENVNKLCFISPMGFPVRLPDSIKVMYIPWFAEYVFTVAGPRLMTSFVEKDIVSGLSADYLEAYKKQMRYKGFRDAIISTVRNVPLNSAIQLYQQIGKQRTPVLLIWGTKDTVTPYGNSETARTIMPKTRFLPVYGAGHAAHLEQPEIVHRAMIEFLQNN